MMKSPNFTPVKEERDIFLIVLHHTNMVSCETAIERMRDKTARVSSHYIINKENGEIIQLVDNQNIAYHAGKSYWRGFDKLNRFSIGIELDNNGSEEFSKPLMDSLLKLLHELKDKYDIKQENIIGHLDVAPTRKDDPHHKFDWKLLSEHGFGLYPREYSDNFKPCDENPAEKLALFGYDCTDINSTIKAFNRHFNPQSCEEGLVEIWTESSNLYLNDLIAQSETVSMNDLIAS